MWHAMILALIATTSLATVGELAPARPQTALSGTLRPSGPPKAPTRSVVGPACVVDLEQGYRLDGALAGEMQIDFRIYVAGDCAEPPGTHDEHWISHGTYAVRIEGEEATGTLIYLAKVKAGGKVEGTLTLAGDLAAELEVTGRFPDGFLSYAGRRTGSE